jgi:hypothetical protein
MCFSPFERGMPGEVGQEYCNYPVSSFNRDNGSSQTLKLAKIEEIPAYQSMKEQKERQRERNVLKLLHSLAPSRATPSRDYPETSLIGSHQINSELGLTLCETCRSSSLLD